MTVNTKKAVPKDRSDKKKHLHRCKCLIYMINLVGRAGVEPTTNGLKEVSRLKNLYKSMT